MRGTVAGFGWTPMARRALRYSAVSVFNVVLGETIVAVAFGALHWTAQASAVLATTIATGPAYMLNRAWVWRRTGRSHLLQEVAPFWALAFVGLGLSTWAADRARVAALTVNASRTVQTIAVMAATLAAFGVIWVVRFVVLDTVIFAADRCSDGAPLEPHDASG